MSAKKLLAVLAALLLITAACGDDDDGDASSTTTSVSEAADTPGLTFDGTACTYAGPAEVTAGVVAVEFVNTGDANASVVVLKIDEGYTADDVAEWVDDPTIAAFPPWLSDMGTGGTTRAEPGETVTWEAALDAGEYSLLCVPSSTPAPVFGSGLTVTAG